MLRNAEEIIRLLVSGTPVWGNQMYYATQPGQYATEMVLLPERALPSLLEFARSQPGKYVRCQITAEDLRDKRPRHAALARALGVKRAAVWQFDTSPNAHVGGLEREQSVSAATGYAEGHQSQSWQFHRQDGSRIIPAWREPDDDPNGPLRYDSPSEGEAFEALQVGRLLLPYVWGGIKNQTTKDLEEAWEKRCSALRYYNQFERVGPRDGIWLCDIFCRNCGKPQTETKSGQFNRGEFLCGECRHLWD